MKKILEKIKKLSNEKKFWSLALLCIIFGIIKKIFNLDDSEFNLIYITIYFTILFFMLKYYILDVIEFIKEYKCHKNGNR